MLRFTWLRAALAAIALAATSFNAQAQLAPAERDALVALHGSTNGAGWMTATNWLTGDPCGPAPWYGVICDGGGQHVTELHLSGNLLTGTLPDLSALSSLVRLNVSDNSLSGPLTTIGSLTSLEGFWASNNQFSGYLPNLPAMTALGYFYVNGNQLIGPIPDISGMTSLRDFRVSTNQLTGVPPVAPTGLIAGGSSLCPNHLQAPSLSDPQWSTATGETEWWRWCTPGLLVAIGGAAVPTPGVVVQSGDTASFTLTADPGYTVGAITSSCGGTLAGNVFTTAAVTADCVINVAMIAPPTAAVPALGSWSLLLLGALAAGLGLRHTRRARRQTL